VRRVPLGRDLFGEGNRVGGSRVFPFPAMVRMRDRGGGPEKTFFPWVVGGFIFSSCNLDFVGSSLP
jgi:hypothetical protein